MRGGGEPSATAEAYLPFLIPALLLAVAMAFLAAGDSLAMTVPGSVVMQLIQTYSERSTVWGFIALTRHVVGVSG